MMQLISAAFIRQPNFVPNAKLWLLCVAANISFSIIVVAAPKLLLPKIKLLVIILPGNFAKVVSTVFKVIPPARSF